MVTGFGSIAVTLVTPRRSSPRPIEAVAPPPLDTIVGIVLSLQPSPINTKHLCRSEHSLHSPANILTAERVPAMPVGRVATLSCNVAIIWMENQSHRRPCHFPSHSSASPDC